MHFNKNRESAMNSVEPIRNLRVIQAIKNSLKGQEKWRDYALFVCGLNFALRVSDLLRLKVSDVRDELDSIKESFALRERKTNKEKTVAINRGAREALEAYFKRVHMEQDDPLFKNPHTGRALHRTQVYRLLNEWCWSAGLRNVRIGTHSLRKSFGYAAFKRGVPIELLQKKFGHSSSATTLRYVGITGDDIRKLEEEIIL